MKQPKSSLKALMDHGLSGVCRLKHASQFDWVRTQGRTLAKTPHFVLHAAPDFPKMSVSEEYPGVRLGLGQVIPKRWARCAVTRNLIRRQTYAVYATYAPRLCQVQVSHALQTPVERPSQRPVSLFVVRLRQVFSRLEFISASSEKLRHAVRAELNGLFEKACASLGV